MVSKSVRIFVNAGPDAFDLLRCLAPGHAHDVHQLGGHLCRHLVLNTAFAVWIGVEKFHEFFFGDSGPFQAVEKLAEAHLAAQLSDASEQLLTIGTDSTKKSGAFSAINTLTHDPLTQSY